MKDRSVEFPNRYRLTKVAGTDDIFDLVPAPGDVTEEGTYINKATLLKDTTAALFGLDSKAVPDDVLNVLNTLVGTAQSTANTAQSTANTAKSAADTAQSTADARAKIATGSYKGTGSSGSVTLNFDFEPKLVMIYQSCYWARDGKYGDEGMAMYFWGAKTMLTITGGWTDGSSESTYANANTVSTAGNTLSWPGSRMNRTDGTYNTYTYYYVAIG